MEELAVLRTVPTRHHDYQNDKLGVQDVLMRRKSGITSAITLNTTAAGVLPEFCHLPAATSNLTHTLITSATTLAGCHRKGRATLVHSWQSVTSFKL
jgi:hypothetical protein